MSVYSTTFVTPVRALLLLGFAGFSWGTGGLAGLVLADQGHLHPVAVAAYRLLVGGVLLLAILRLRGSSIPHVWTPQIAARTALVGGLLAVFQAAYFASVAVMSVGLATLTVMMSATVMITLGTAFAERSMPSAGTVAVTALALVGLVLLLGGDGQDGGGGPTGTVLALISAAGFAALTLDRREPPVGLANSTLTGLGFLAGGCLLLPAGLVTGMTMPVQTQVIGALAYLALVPTALAYAAYFAGIGQAGTGAGVVALLMEPLTATVLAVLLLQERLSAAQWGGLALILAAVALRSRVVPAA